MTPLRRASMMLAVLVLAGCQSSPKSPPPARGRATPSPMMGQSATPAPKLEIPDGRQASTPRQNPVTQGTDPQRSAVAPSSAPKPPSDTVIRATVPAVTPPGAPEPEQETKAPADPDRPSPSKSEPPDRLRPPAVRRAIDDSSPSQPQSNEAKLRELHRQAAAKYEGMQDYIARFRRREFVNGKQQPDELMLVRFKKPFSIYFKWLEGGAFEGREAIYVEGRFNNEIQTKTGRGDVISGMRVSVPPHSEKATKTSRRTIDEAGLGNLVRRFGNVLAAQESGARTFGPLHYAGRQQRPECPLPMECAVQQVPPGVEKHLPRGGTRYWFFNADPQAKEHALPTLIVTLDENRREVEYYCHDRLNINVGLRPEEFEPDLVWAKEAARR